MKSEYNEMDRRLILIVLVFFSTAPLAFSRPQSLEGADFSDARMSIAGPREVYLRNVTMDGSSYSVVIRAEDELGTEWKITEVYPDDANYAPEGLILDVAAIEVTGRDGLSFSGIYLDGGFYSAEFEIDPAGNLEVTEPLSSVETPGDLLERLGGFGDIIAEIIKERYEQRISALIEESEAKSERIESLEEDLESARDEIVRLEILREKTETAAAEDASPEEPSRDILNYDFTRTLLTGFTQSVPQIGSWTVEGDTAVQTDPEQYFAKLLLPIEQRTQPTLYSYETRSTGSGWVGTGLHIFVTDTTGKKGYGLGNSLLVWLTRDPEYYGTDDTRLQLYRSDGAVQMEMVLDAVIEEPISGYLDMDIIYDPITEYISVSVDGTEKIRYKTWFGIDSGLEIALRSLGDGARFRNLSVSTVE
jgi:hypothetical protein